MTEKIKFLIVNLLLGHLSFGQSYIDIGDRRELFVDDYLIEQKKGIEHRLQTPIPMGSVMKFDESWEGQFSTYVSVVHAEDLYRMYYRGIASDNRPLAEMTCYAVSVDGIHWIKPNLGLFEINGTTQNNVVLTGSDLQTSHNLAVFYDGREGVKVEERFKAIGGTASNQTRKKKGLYRYVSSDGVNWKLFEDSTALFTGYGMDSQNILTWLPEEECYAIYLRSWTEDKPGDTKMLKGIRTISRSTSKDFIHWSEPKQMSFGDAPLEDLYTNATQPYFRAPHILIATPFRFAPNSKALTEEEFDQYDIHTTMRQGVSDGVLMTSRGGERYDRTFLESFIRPGLNSYNWAARSNIPAAGIVQTGDDEMSIYVTRAYGTDNVYLERLKLRLDGFASLTAPYTGGEVLTKPFIFRGKELEINYATSSVGQIKIEIQDENGKPIPGFTLEDCERMTGDHISRRVTWKGSERLESLVSMPIRLRIVMKDADIYAFKFNR